MPPEPRVLNLFPTPLWIVDLDPAARERINGAILERLNKRIGARAPAPPGGTLQSETDVHTMDEFADLFTQCAAAVEAVLDFLQVDYRHFEITGSWLNINPPGGINTPHTHPNNFLSGVYYVQTAKGADRIFFTDPRPQASVIMPRVRRRTVYTGNEVSIDACDGRIILFPAWLNHGVPANRSNRDRISVAFNVMFSDYTKEMSAPQWTGPLKLRRANDSRIP